MKLHDLHSKHKTLAISKAEADESVPKLVWQKYKGRPEELKKRKSVLAQDPETAYDYATVEGPFPEGEKAIATDATYSLLYASSVLHGPFKLGEPAIAKNASRSLSYAMDVLKGPFKLGEPAIAKDAAGSLRYAIDVLNGPFKAGEPAMKHDSYSYYWHRYQKLLDPSYESEADKASKRPKPNIMDGDK